MAHGPFHSSVRPLDDGGWLQIEAKISMEGGTFYVSLSMYWRDVTWTWLMACDRSKLVGKTNQNKTRLFTHLCLKVSFRACEWQWTTWGHLFVAHLRAPDCACGLRRRECIWPMIAAQKLQFSKECVRQSGASHYHACGRSIWL